MDRISANNPEGMARERIDEQLTACGWLVQDRATPAAEESEARMTIYRITSDRIEPLASSTFQKAGLRERSDLQRLLRAQLDVVVPGVMVLAEEFGEWEDSRRRIDLLGLDQDANLVVVELKRTEDGGHLELQAVRYAAMVAPMTFDQAVAAHAAFRERLGLDGDARQAILEFLGWDDTTTGRFGERVRIVLVSADFSAEVTTTVLWLNASGLDIRCVRLRPYAHEGEVLVDVQQVIPLPEAEDYMVRLRAKEQERTGYRWQPKSWAEIWRDFEANCDPEDVAVAHRLHDWLGELGLELFTTTNAFAFCRPRETTTNRFFFKVGTNGRIELWFQYLANKPPFADEGLRRELAHRLSTIAGMDALAQKFTGRPTIPLSALRPEAGWTQFTQTWTWALEKIAEAEQRAQGTGSKGEPSL